MLNSTVWTVLLPRPLTTFNLKCANTLSLVPEYLICNKKTERWSKGLGCRSGSFH